MVVVAPVPALTVQLLREWPPGYGGIERVAHQLAAVWRGTVFSLDAQPHLRDQLDALPVNYPRRILPRFAIGRLLIPWPSKALLSLLNSAEPLHGHLPSPGVLLILVLARLMRPHRRVTAHWHCFLELSPGFNGRLFGVYQRLALFLVAHLSGVVTTSPLLAEELDRCGCQRQRAQRHVPREGGPGRLGAGGPLPGQPGLPGPGQHLRRRARAARVPALDTLF